jgi:hypothetical protein
MRARSVHGLALRVVPKRILQHFQAIVYREHLSDIIIVE